MTLRSRRAPRLADHGRRTAWLAATLLGGTVLALAACAPVPEAPAALPETFIPEVSSSPVPSVDSIAGFTPLERISLRVRVRTCSSYMTGTAWMLDDRHAVTNRHVVEGATDIALTTYDGVEFKGRSSVLDPDSDLALVTITSSFPEVGTMADTEPAHSDTLTISGYPEGEALRVTSGPYLGLVADDVSGSDDFVYQIRAESHPGNSGSPVANEEGDVVGVLYASDSISTSYAVSLPTLEHFLDNLGDADRNRANC